MTSRLVEVPFGLNLEFVGHEPLFIRLQHLPHAAVVRPLARALLNLTNSDGPIKAPATAKAYRNAIARFARWLDEIEFNGDLSNLTVAQLYEFGALCSAPMERNLRTLMSATVPLGVSPDVAEQLDGRGVAQRGPRSTPLTAYSHGEFHALVDACRASIVAWESDRSLDPPGPHVILAYRILLGLELGIPAESLNSLRLSGIRWQGDREVRVEYVKARADGRQAVTFQLRGPWSGPSLLQRWMRASGPMRSRAGSYADRLWLTIDLSGAVKPARFPDYEWRASRLSFLALHDLRTDNGERLALDLRRLRTTWIARKARDWHDAVTVDPNHSATVEGDHYLTRSADPEVVDSLIEDAQRDLVLRAEHVALVVMPDDERADLVDGPAGTQQRAQQQQEEPPGPQRWDMFAAACKDPFNSPFAPTGSFCSAPIWTCLVCELGLVTPSKLPALLRLYQYLQERSAQVTEREWLIAYAPAWVQLTTRILPGFDDAAISAAWTVIENDEDLPVPTNIFLAP